MCRSPNIPIPNSILIICRRSYVAELFIRPKNSKISRIKIDPQNIRYSIPTISNELPLFSDKYPFYDFTHTIHEDNWRQMEFLPQNELPVIEEEMKMVEDIIFPEDNPTR
jgi:hypothetical protein